MTLPDRNGVFWWGYVAVLAGAALFIAYSFVGVLVLGLFGYYATRPVCARFEAVVDSERVAAALTVLAVLVPMLVLALYAGIRTFQQVQRRFEGDVVSLLLSRVVGFDVEGDGPMALLRDPPSVDRLTELLSGSALQEGLAVLDAVFGTVLLLALAVTLSYALLVYDAPLSAAFAELVGGREQTVYVYAAAVDTDLESVFYGNLLFVLLMSGVATVTYAATNFVAPPGTRIPMVFTLGALTGITSLIPIVVSKVVYLPVVAYLALTAPRGGVAFVGAVLVVYVLVLDILPQSVLQPYVSGRQLNPMALLFAYLLGPVLFGWYGFFFMPIVLVLMLEVVRIVLPELLHGDPIVPEPELAEGTGADADEIHESDPDATPSGTDGSDPDRA